MMSRWCLIWTGESIPVNIPVNATKNHYASHACWLCLKNRLPLASNGSNQYHPHMFPIWLFNSSPWKIHPFLIGEPSISMGHLYHGYVKNQMVNGHYIALPCYSPRYYQIYQTPKRGAEMRIANRHPPGSEGRCPPHGWRVLWTGRDQPWWWMSKI